MSNIISRRDFISSALGTAAALTIPSFSIFGQDENQKLKVTVCELNNDDGDFSKEWHYLIDHIKKEKSDLLLLPEFVFAPWFPFEKEFNQKVWQEAVKNHEEWKNRLKECAPAVVLGSGPVNSGGKRLNEAFIWDSSAGYKPAHYKYYLPDLRRFWEASWYHRGSGDFTPVKIKNAVIGFMTCSDIWFFQHSRNYGKSGAHIIACPRATSNASVERFITAGRTTSIVSGAYCLSSNRVSKEKNGWCLAGTGWITDPARGEILGLTSREKPFLTMEIDLNRAVLAKKGYPLSIGER
jgi:predicted amidohydrolase